METFGELGNVGVHEYVYGAVPPDDDKAIAPSAPPKQLTLVTVEVIVICEKAIEPINNKVISESNFFIRVV